MYTCVVLFITGVPEEDLPSVSPVFTTQPLDAEGGNHRSNRKPGAGSEGGDTGRSSMDGTNRSGKLYIQKWLNLCL